MPKPLSWKDFTPHECYAITTCCDGTWRAIPAGCGRIAIYNALCDARRAVGMRSIAELLAWGKANL